MCPTCGKAFRVRANYYKHRKIHERTSAEQQLEQQDQQRLQIHNDQMCGDEDIQGVATHSASEQISPVTITMPTPQTGLLENFNVRTI